MYNIEYFPNNTIDTLASSRSLFSIHKHCFVENAERVGLLCNEDPIIGCLLKSTLSSSAKRFMFFNHLSYFFYTNILYIIITFKNTIMLY